MPSDYDTPSAMAERATLCGSEGDDARNLSALFLGNSLTYFNGGIDAHFRFLCSAASDGVDECVTDTVTKGGASLAVLASSKTKAIRTILEGGYDFTVLQEDLPESDVKSFESAATKLCRASWSAGSTPVLMMMWPYERLRSTSLLDIVAAHRGVAARLNAGGRAEAAAAAAGEGGEGDEARDALPAVRVAPVATAMHALQVRGHMRLLLSLDTFCLKMNHMRRSFVSFTFVVFLL